MSELLSTLTQAELLALALASSRNDSGSALAYLKEAASRADVSAEALFMLGSEYAQLKLLPEAHASLTRAIELSPTLHIARFQLGLLQLSSGQVDEARATWAPLTLLDEQHPQRYLEVFHCGLISLIADQFEEAAQALQEGLRLNRSNAPLNADMLRILDAIEHLPGRPTSAPAPAHQGSKNAIGEAESEPSHLFINAYTHRGPTH